jgi:hypothetical protein
MNSGAVTVEAVFRREYGRCVATLLVTSAAVLGLTGGSSGPVNVAPIVAV